MTGEEKRKQLKEQYKKELQARKEFKEKVERLRKLKNLNSAVTDMTTALGDDSDDWIRKIDEETAFMEAKTEMAMDSESTLDKEITNLQQQVEVEKMTAKDLVNEMKREMGLLPDEPEVPEEEAAEAASETEESPADETKTEEDQTDSPKKTLGDF